MSAEAFDLSAYLPPPYVTHRPPVRRILVLDGYPPRDGADPQRRRALRLVEGCEALMKVAGTGLPEGIRNSVCYWNTSEEQLMSIRYPRNVPWTHLPALGAPSWSLGDGMQGWRSDSFVPLETDAWTLLSDVTHLVFIPGRFPKLTMIELVHLQRTIGRTLECFIQRDDALEPLAQEQLQRMEQDNRAFARLGWNWNWNAGMFLPALVDEAFRTRRPPGGKTHINRIRYGRTWESSALQALQSSPIALQLLYWVARQRPRPVPYDRASPASRYPGILSGAGTTRVSCGPVTSLDWTGHGVTREAFEERGQEGLAFCRHLMGAADSLYDGALLLADMDRRACLSPAGAHLLRLLPPGCRDLGMPTRWATPDGIGQDGDIPAMDRWCTTILRHIKKAANDLRPPVTTRPPESSCDAEAT